MKPLQSPDFKKPHVWVATWFGFGLLKPGPGTWGTIGALPFGMLILKEAGITALGIAFMTALLLGLWSAARFEEETGHHDPAMIVIDEVAGMWLALMFTTGSLLSMLTAFLLFRVFDIWKPWPVSWGDKKPGAFGVMADDVIAGIIAGLLTGILSGRLKYVGLG